MIHKWATTSWWLLAELSDSGGALHGLIYRPLLSVVGVAVARQAELDTEALKLFLTLFLMVSLMVQLLVPVGAGPTTAQDGMGFASESDGSSLNAVTL
jgi:hypothetical protein